MSQQSSAQFNIKTRYDWLRRFSGLYRALGVDLDKMLVIMELKTKLLTRGWQQQRLKANTHPNSKKPKSKRPVIEKDISLFNWGKSFVYLFCSLFMMIYGFYFNDPGIALSLSFLVCFVMQFLGVITDFPLIILDTKDSTILATKPVDSQTVSAAKSTLTIIYMAINSFSLYALLFIPYLYKGLYGIAGMMLISVLLSNLICVALAYYLYGMVLKFFDGEKLKDILSAFQILLAAFIMISYQVVARIMDIVSPNVNLTFQWWQLLIPSYWLTYITTAFTGASNYPSLLLGLVSLTIVCLILLLHFKVTGKILEANLNKMLSEGEKSRGLYGFKIALQNRISKLLFPKDHEARAFYMLGYSVAGNDRKMKQTIYPLYVSMMIMPAVMVLNALEDYGNNVFKVFAEVPLIVLSLYFCAFATSTIILYTHRTENPKGAWVYDVLPVKNINSAYRGAAVSLIVKYIVPPMLGITLIMGLLGGIPMLDDLFLINLFVLLMAGLVMVFDHINWPFILELSENNGRNTIFTIITLVVPMAFAGLHALLVLFVGTHGVWMAGSLCLLALILVFTYLKHRKADLL